MKPNAVRLIAPLAVLFIFLASSAFAAWTSVGDGIEYQAFLQVDTGVDGINNFFVARMLRSNTNAFLESSMANGKLSGSVQSVPNQAALYEDAINYWGESWGKRDDVIVAINGDFWNTALRPTGGQMHQGWYSKSLGAFGGWSGFLWTLDRGVFLGGCTNDQASNMKVIYSDGSTQTINGFNAPHTTASDEMFVFTPQWDKQTPSSTGVSEIVVKMDKPALVTDSSAPTSGYVVEVRQGLSQTPLPFDCIVLSAKGTVATTMLTKATVGSLVRIRWMPTDYNAPDVQGNNGCAYSTGVSWKRTYAHVGGNYIFLKNGAILPPDEVAHPGYQGLVDLNPRTAICYNAQYIFFVVNDGRSAISAGTSMTGLGNFCKDVLGATDGMNQDGGGSSTMVVNGVVKNVPSDGSPRLVANGMLMCNILPKQTSGSFAAGHVVKTNASSAVRMGPGSNYGFVNTMANNSQGTVLAHDLSGVYAKGYNWWKVDFGSSKVGWVQQNQLSLTGYPPVITQHPAPAVVRYGGTASFTVVATGLPAPTYQWQKDSSNLSNGGHYSNVTTDTLTVTGADPSDVGSYRCVVTNMYGSVNSNAASLTMDQTPPGTVTVTDQGSWTPSLTSLSATWTAADDGNGSGIDRYECAVGTSATTQNTKSWYSVGKVNSAVIGSMTLAEGQKYHVQVRAINGSGLIGAGSAADGIVAAPGAARISDAWTRGNLSDGLSLRNKVVTAYVDGGFWLEETNQSSGIKVLWPSAITPGNTVSIAGWLTFDGPQRVLQGDVIENYGGGTKIDPLGITQKYLGGANYNPATPGITGGIGLYNIGMLMRVCGRIDYSDSTDPSNRYFFLDDGSGLARDGHKGVKVYCGSTEPPSSDWAAANGVVGSETAGGKTVPVIYIRGSGDLTTL